MKKYKNVISLGFFCGPASELERIGLRNASYPFDWLISEFPENLKLIESNFEDFLNYDNLYQHKKNRTYYYDIKHKIHFYHDFDSFSPLSSQLQSIKEKYNRRIERFYKTITKPTLFIRYITNQEEIDYINNNLEYITNTLQKFNKNNEIIFIGNDELTSEKVHFYSVKRDEGDIVARMFLNNNKELHKFLLDNTFVVNENNVENIKIHPKKVKSIKAKKVNILYKLKKIVKKTYIHTKEI